LKCFENLEPKSLVVYLLPLDVVVLLIFVSTVHFYGNKMGLVLFLYLRARTTLVRQKRDDAVLYSIWKASYNGCMIRILNMLNNVKRKICYVICPFLFSRKQRLLSYSVLALRYRFNLRVF